MLLAVYSVSFVFSPLDKILQALYSTSLCYILYYAILLGGVLLSIHSITLFYVFFHQMTHKTSVQYHIMLYISFTRWCSISCVHHVSVAHSAGDGFTRTSGLHPRSAGSLLCGGGAVFRVDCGLQLCAWGSLHQGTYRVAHCICHVNSRVGYILL